MQFYEFECPVCKVPLEPIRMSFTEYDEMMNKDPLKCPDCGETLSRVYSPQIKWNCPGGTGASL